jgi:hypothetical protein
VLLCSCAGKSPVERANPVPPSPKARETSERLAAAKAGDVVPADKTESKVKRMLKIEGKSCAKASAGGSGAAAA